MLIVGNGRLVTRDANNPFLEDGAVCLGRIRRQEDRLVKAD